MKYAVKRFNVYHSWDEIAFPTVSKQINNNSFQLLAESVGEGFEIYHSYGFAIKGLVGEHFILRKPVEDFEDKVTKHVVKYARAINKKSSKRKAKK